ncbi:MAG: alpha/beta hydrolase [Thermoplasmata archaeon]
MPNATRADVTLYYETHGSAGDPTVVVHDSWEDHQGWARLVPSLSQALALVTYDRRGHGASVGPPRERPVRDDASDLAMLLESIDLFPAHVIGCSYGAVVALRLAIDRPELVRSVAVHEPPFLGLLEDGPSWLGDLAARARAGVREMQDRARQGDRSGAARQFIERLAPVTAAADRLGFAPPGGLVPGSDLWVEEYADPETMSPSRTELAGLDLPILLTTGESSAPLFHGIQAELTRVLRNASARTLPGIGEVPLLTQPEVYAGALVSFLLERDVPST